MTQGDMEQGYGASDQSPAKHPQSRRLPPVISQLYILLLAVIVLSLFSCVGQIWDKNWAKPYSEYAKRPQPIRVITERQLPRLQIVYWDWDKKILRDNETGREYLIVDIGFGGAMVEIDNISITPAPDVAHEVK